MKPEDNLKEKFIKGSLWTMTQQVIFTLLGFIQLMITSRLLTPIDFGIYAIALFFSSIGKVAFSIGFSGALVQKKGNIDNYINTAWSSGIMVSVVSILIIMLFIPFACKYYFNNPTSLWPSIVLVLSGIFIPASSSQTIYFIKNIELKKYFYLQIIPKIISFGLVLFFVFKTRSYWGLVIAMAMENLIYFILSWIIAPRRVQFEINKEKFKELYSFGMWLQLKNLVSWASSNLDVAVVGNVLGSGKLGLYNRSQSISSYPRNLIDSIINMVAFPVYSKLRTDKDGINMAFNKIQNLSLLVLSCVILVFWLYGENIVLLVLGEQWIEMSQSFKILASAYILQGFLFSFNPLLRSYGYTKCEFLTFIVQIVSMVCLLYPLTNMFDLIGAGVAVLISVLLTLPLMLFFVYKYTEIRLTPVIVNIIIAISVILISYLLSSIICIGEINWVMCLIISILILFSTYIIVYHLIKKGPGSLIVKDLFSMVRNKLC